MALRLRSELVGLELGPCTSNWEARDAILYALGIGARADRDLDFLYEGRGPRVMPTFGVLAGQTILPELFERVEAPWKLGLHAEQALSLERPLPAVGQVRTRGFVSEVWDKGQAALVRIESETADDAGVLLRNSALIYLPGAGGFGGERGPSSSRPGEAGPPDLEARDVTSPEQAALYRLSGDRNPLHIDPSFAARAGFQAPILHGLCSFGFASRLLLDHYAAGDDGRFQSFRARFSGPVYPGDQLFLRAWKRSYGLVGGDLRTDRGEAALTGIEFAWKAD